MFRRAAVGLSLFAAVTLVGVPVAGASTTSGTLPAVPGAIATTHCQWMGVGSPPGGTSFVSTSVAVGSGASKRPASFAGWTYCVGNKWFIGARFDGIAARPFVWNELTMGYWTPGLVATQMLEVYPGAPPTIVVSTGTGYNWNSYDLFTVRRGRVVAFTGDVGRDKYPIQMRDSGGAGDYFHFTCSRANNGAVELVQQEYLAVAKGWTGPTPEKYKVDSYEYLAVSGRRVHVRSLPTETEPSAALSFTPSQFC